MTEREIQAEKRHMTDTRWHEIMNWRPGQPDPELTPDEVREGWHFCWEFDGLLVGPGMEETKICQCNLNRTDSNET